MMSRLLEKYREETQDLDAAQLLAWGLQTFSPERLVLASSLGAEDQVLTALLINMNTKARIFTLDTGRLFQETYDVMQATTDRYHFSYEVCFPDANDVKQMVEERGINLFYKSIEDRKLCCEVRKMKPLRKLLATADCWITGLRKGQSVTRTNFQKVEWDDTFGIYKINPLIDWTDEAVWEFIRSHEIPYNALHDKGFASIGCQPCTRAIKPGEDIRAGRWWWEAPEQKECWLHWKNGAIVKK